MRGWGGLRRMAISISEQWRQNVRNLFPGLIEGVNFEFTSEVDFGYNCLSWALSINHSLLDDVAGGFWPWRDIPPDTADGWTELCRRHGFTLLAELDTTFNPAYEKIAIFEDNDGELHACRQEKDGVWKSKLGSMGPDIDHIELTALETCYGRVVRVLQKERQN